MYTFICEVFKFYVFLRENFYKKWTLKILMLVHEKKSESMKVYWMGSIKMKMCYVHNSK